MSLRLVGLSFVFFKEWMIYNVFLGRVVLGRGVVVMSWGIRKKVFYDGEYLIRLYIFL